MKSYVEKINKTKVVRISIFTAFMLFMIVFSIVCIKKYIKNSNVVQFDLNTFTLSEGYEGGVENGSFVIRAGENEGVRDFCSTSSYTLLDKGIFNLGIAYKSDFPTVAYWQAGDEIYDEIQLPAGEQTIFHDFTLEQSVEDARLRIVYPGSGTFVINTFVVACDRPIVTDWIAVLGIGWGLAFVGILYLVFFMEESMTRKHLLEIGFIVVVALLSIPYLEFTNKGIYWGTDTLAHNMRVEGLKDALLDGQFPVVIAPSMCNGYGSIAPIMYPSLFLYPLAILRILGVSPVMVYKIAHVFINIFMCSTCYVCVKKITRSIKASSLSLLLFAFSKYHLTMVGVKDWTYGMGIAIIFVFVVIIGLYEIIFGKGNEWPYLTLGMWGIMNSHILTTLLAAFLVFFFVCVFIKKILSENRLSYLVKAVFAAIPLCLYRMYTFLDASINNELNTAVLNLKLYDDTVYSIKDYFTEKSLLVIWVVVFAGIVFLICNRKITSDCKKIVAASIGMIAFCVLFMSKYMPWNMILETKLGDAIFGYIQFANRILQVLIPVAVVVFGIIAMSCINSGVVGKVCLSILCGMVVLISFSTYHSEIDEIGTLPEAFTGKITGDVLSFPGMDDYVLEGESRETYGGHTPYLSSNNISINYDTYDKNGVNISCNVECSEDDSYIDFPIFGYKGYICVDENGNRYKTGVGEHHRLRVYVDKAEGVQVLNIGYKVPAIYFILQIISYVSMLILVTFNRDFLARTKEKIGYYNKLRKIRQFYYIIRDNSVLLLRR